MSTRFDGRVAIVTGAGNGLGRAYAQELARRGAKVLVNDVGRNRNGKGSSFNVAQAVADEIKECGGDATADGSDVTKRDDVEAMVKNALKRWNRVDVLINNASIVRDKTFANMEPEDFRAVIDVHLLGSLNCSKCVWEQMRTQGYGRILMTTSSSGLYGNFGQSNYGAAKAAVIGLMRSLHHEGRARDIRVNAISPAAAPCMTDYVMSPAIQAVLEPAAVVPAAVFLVSENAPSGTILCTGGGGYAMAQMVETRGIYLPEHERTPEAIEARFSEIADGSNACAIDSAYGQTYRFAEIAEREKRGSTHTAIED